MQSNHSYPSQVTLFEVGPRDGLQNEFRFVPTHIKLELIRLLAESGLTKIEATSFVSPQWVPQMADHSELMQALKQSDTESKHIDYPVLTPNLQGFDAAINAGAKEVAVFAAASENFSQKNINCSIEQSIERFKPLMQKANQLNIPVRGYVSCVLGCPYQGIVEPQIVAKVSKQLLDIGCYQISLGDTIGTGNPQSTEALLSAVGEQIAIEQLAVHFHDTYGLALANIMVALNKGISTIDSSVAGLGGCPYAKGASGNVATEDVVYLLDKLAIKSNINLDKLVDAGDYISQYLARENGSKVATAILAKRSN